jgi:hypothetical protein
LSLEGDLIALLNKNKSNISGIKKYRLTLKIKTACVSLGYWSFSSH